LRAALSDTDSPLRHLPTTKNALSMSHSRIVSVCAKVHTWHRREWHPDPSGPVRG
jgi:hypothetical protein